jgi:hypothetical protein
MEFVRNPKWAETVAANRCMTNGVVVVNGGAPGYSQPDAVILSPWTCGQALAGFFAGQVDLTPRFRVTSGRHHDTGRRFDPEFAAQATAWFHPSLTVLHCFPYG